MQINTEYIIQKNCLKLQEYSLNSQTGFDYWHSCLMDINNLPVSGGFGCDKHTSRKIALAEFLERDAYKSISSSDYQIQKKWGLDLMPTGCGFAAGFNHNNTIIRSVGEAVERWVISKWIDEGHLMDSVTDVHALSVLDPISNWFYRQFDKVYFYKKEIIVMLHNEFYKFQIGATIGRKNSGVYVGYSAQINDNNLWQHALLESFRHFLIEKNNNPINIFPDNRIRFFGKNADYALSKIPQNSQSLWPIPKIIHFECEENSQIGFFLARTIIDGWKSWHLGGDDRFLY